MPPAESVHRPRNGWITRRWSFGPLLPRSLQERGDDSLSKSTVLFICGWCSSVRQYKIYIQLENIASWSLLFLCRHRQWRPDKQSAMQPGRQSYVPEMRLRFKTTCDIHDRPKVGWSDTNIGAPSLTFNYFLNLCEKAMSACVVRYIYLLWFFL
jgi:hypothetical protein